MRVTGQTFFERPDDFMTVCHLTLRGTNFQIGRKPGELFVERYGGSLARFAADPVYARAPRVYFERNYPIHRERVWGVAAVYGLDPEDDRYDSTNLMYNVNAPVRPMRMQALGCSVVRCPPSTTATGSGYLSRDYDFGPPQVVGLHELQVATDFQVHRRPTPDSMPDGTLTPETNAFWRYQTPAQRLAEHRSDYLEFALD